MFQYNSQRFATIVHSSLLFCAFVHTISHFCSTVRDRFLQYCAWLCTRVYVRQFFSSSLHAAVIFVVVFISFMCIWYTLWNKNACNTYCAYGYQFNLTSGALSFTQNNSGKMISFMNNLHSVRLIYYMREREYDRICTCPINTSTYSLSLLSS